MDSRTSPLPHVAIFPFMSKGHTIPMLHLAHLLHRRRLVSHITFFTTSGNALFIHSSLSSIAAQSISIISLPFPDNLPPDIPTGVKSIDHLPSIDLFLPFVNSIYHMRPAFSQAISQLSPLPSLLISDAFLCWTLYVATELNIPRLVFNGIGGFSQTVSVIVAIHKPQAEVPSSNESFAIPGFTHLSLTKDDLEPPFDDPDPKGPHWNFGVEQWVKISAIQMKELATGLERSGLDFIWIIQAQECNWDDGFEQRLEDRCRLVKEWVDQIEILAHKAVYGFMTHCGWNSVMESMCTSVPVLAWTMMAEQRLNAKFVV
ncbi:hypothetical protein LUZ61_002994 [Rhynchospora tenuis]|uniref:Uncharacterized protein n=1 Tax=Rhynchospora tenuis TaxID=198213 RepID=A0AAD5ZJX7_9POAL|nr:hypothetical protein LUZ61_002994 [Rhynchospora tenuis]